MRKTFFEEFLSDRENERIYRQEGLIVEFAEMVAELMHVKQVKKRDLAKRLGVSPSQVTQWLDGTANLQLRTVSDILFALDSKLRIEAEPLRLEHTLHVQKIKHSDWRAASPPRGKYAGHTLRYQLPNDLQEKMAG